MKMAGLISTYKRNAQNWNVVDERFRVHIDHSVQLAGAEVHTFPSLAMGGINCQHLSH